MSRSRSWKDTKAKDRTTKRYGKRDNSKRNTLFMIADEQIFGKEED